MKTLDSTCSRRGCQRGRAGIREKASGINYFALSGRAFGSGLRSGVCATIRQRTVWTASPLASLLPERRSPGIKQENGEHLSVDTLFYMRAGGARGRRGGASVRRAERGRAEEGEAGGSEEGP